MVQFISTNERATKLIPYGVYGNVKSRPCEIGKDTGLFNVLLYQTAGYQQEVKMCLLEYFDKLTNKWYYVKTHGIIQEIEGKIEFIHVSSRGREKDLHITFKKISDEELDDNNCRNF